MLERLLPLEQQPVLLRVISKRHQRLDPELAELIAALVGEAVSSAVSGFTRLLRTEEVRFRETALMESVLHRVDVGIVVAGADGRVQFSRDGTVVFDWPDPAPLRSGWFGFRTVQSRMEISDFQVHAGPPTAGAAPR